VENDFILNHNSSIIDANCEQKEKQNRQRKDVKMQPANQQETYKNHTRY